jgi:hypothetical protein
MDRRAVLAIMSAVVCVNGAPAQEMTQQQYDQLPKELRDTVREIRASCKELDPEFKPYAIDQGITIVDLEGTRSRDIMLDAEDVCNGRMAGANCTNRGCDLKIWKQTGATSWRKIFDEHLHRKFISLSEDNRFRLMAVSIYAGDPRCKPNPKASHTSGQSCDLLVYYRNHAWVWQKIQ